MNFINLNSIENFRKISPLVIIPLSAARGECSCVGYC